MFVFVFFFVKADHSLLDNQDEECVYMNGNSLGLMPKSTKYHVLNEIEKWSKV